ncbi:MAG: hypothetical protein SVR94_16900 [Pseudomonadota bacterium]|nr:hypothetical protein [Pseudomonadota bacterium]
MSRKKFWHRVKNSIANFIYFKIFKANRDKIPYPLFLFILKQFGGWAGVGIYLPMREYHYKVKMNKFLKYFLIIVGVLVLVFSVIFSILKGSNNFLFGFFQELFAELIFVLLLIYFLPKLLTRRNKYKIAVLGETEIGNLHYQYNDPLINISLKNIGEEVYREKEICWEIYLPFDLIGLENIERVFGEYEIINSLVGKMWKFSSINHKPLFIDQKIELLRLRIDREYFSGRRPSNNPYGFKIYYLIRTVNGNYPTFDNVTQDFMGIGIPIEEYPKFGEINFPDLHGYYRRISGIN